MRERRAQKTTVQQKRDVGTKTDNKDLRAPSESNITFYVQLRRKKINMNISNVTRNLQAQYSDNFYKRQELFLWTILTIFL